MQFATHTGDPLTTLADVIVIGVFEDAVFSSPHAIALDRALDGALKSCAKDEDFKGQPKESVVVPALGKIRAKRVALLGMGKQTGVSARDWLNLGGRAARRANAVGGKHVLLLLPPKVEVTGELAGLLARGAALGNYRYTAYLSDPGRGPTLNKLSLHFAEKNPGIAQRAKRALVVAEGVAIARDLVNESPLQLYPESFAARAEKMGRELGLKVKILKPDQLKRAKMNLLLGVGAGSERTPRLVHLSYTPKSPKKGAKPVVLVGKGITFDSGGLSLKPPAAMEDMKIDMGGAAAAFGIMHCMAKLKPKVPVHAVLALAENMPSGSAIRPGDVIRGAAGKTVEINNTDAEGRLALADALHFATTLKPGHIVDFATLTGACMVALGPTTAALFSDDDQLARGLLDAASRTGESFWRMPINEDLRSQLKSDVADMKNTGERWGGAITAALFLKTFVGDHSWAHLDIAGPVSSKEEAGAFSRGGTGVAVAAVTDWIME